MTDLDLSGKKVLVTGGAGFVGSNVTERAVRAGAEVTVVDDLFTGSLDNIDDDVKYRFVEGSVCDEKLISGLVREADFVVHMAARNIIVSTKNPRNDYEVNIGGTLNVLMAAREFGIKRIVYTSSASVYGNPRIIPIVEEERTHTFSPYSVSKLAGENYCNAFYESYGVPVTAVRYSNVYGPKQDPKNPYCGVISKFIEAIDNDIAPQIHGDGNQTRDYTYVDDAVDATLTALLSPKSEGTVFNLGTGTETTVVELLDILASLFGKEVTPEHIDRRDIDNIRRRVLNIERIRSRLRWQPQIGMKEGLRRTVEWYLSRKK
ncbi:MAG: NAD-dependent epimerase/dehydratase family protein [candidate division Zixibacteria bacterium]|nr:NAD-dependent epimerase/dehydratase family protein [candidate division Zixibacteria bacterium]